MNEPDDTTGRSANLLDLWWPRIVLPAAVILLVDDVLSQDWFGAAMLTLLALYAGTKLLRRNRPKPTGV